MTKFAHKLRICRESQRKTSIVHQAEITGNTRLISMGNSIYEDKWKNIMLKAESGTFKTLARVTFLGVKFLTLYKATL